MTPALDCCTTYYVFNIVILVHMHSIHASLVLFSVTIIYIGLVLLLFQGLLCSTIVHTHKLYWILSLGYFYVWNINVSSTSHYKHAYAQKSRQDNSFRVHAQLKKAIFRTFSAVSKRLVHYRCLRTNEKILDWVMIAIAIVYFRTVISIVLNHLDLKMSL